MNLLFDTNILIAILRSRNYDGIVNFFNPERKLVYISVATEAEIKSIALRLKWGEQRMRRLDNFLAEIIIIDINQNYINSYIEIDTYSQRINNVSIRHLVTIHLRLREIWAKMIYG